MTVYERGFEISANRQNDSSNKQKNFEKLILLKEKWLQTK